MAFFSSGTYVPPVGLGWDIIIFPGQSNTVGGGLGPFADTSSVNDKKIFQVGRFSGNDMTVIPAKRPLDFWNSEFTKKHGGSLSFARLYAASYLAAGRNLLLIPAAKGGTSILEWLDLVPSVLYSDMMLRVELGLGLSGENKVVAWVEQQAEEDSTIALHPDDPRHPLMQSADMYVTRKIALIDRVRSDLGSNFPMIFGFMTDGRAQVAPITTDFNVAIAAAAGQRASCFSVDTVGLPSNFDYDPAQDKSHFSAQGQENLAGRHFSAYTAWAS